MNNFGDTDFLSALDDNIDNPSITGFFIEQAVLSYIGSQGLNISKGICSPMETVMFAGNYPRYNMQRKLALYCPLKFNLQAIDGIIVRLERPKGRAKGKCFMFPLQITVARSHSDSESAFFNQWTNWTKEMNLNKFDVGVEFLWITDKGASADNVSIGTKQLRSGDKVTNPKYTTCNVPLQIIGQEIWDRYQLALNYSKNRSVPTNMEVDEEPEAAEQGGPSGSRIEGSQGTKGGVKEGGEVGYGWDEEDDSKKKGKRKRKELKERWEKGWKELKFTSADIHTL
ncbi:hypothetical protein BDD12DRAFT_847117 [Trichophaea hybrida]|nr:hypothetical protein BDD12DRAFT_847117 [Trichophaea hybrida]